MDLWVPGSSLGRSLQAVFDPGLPQKIQQIFPARLKKEYFCKHIYFKNYFKGKENTITIFATLTVSFLFV